MDEHHKKISFNIRLPISDKYQLTSSYLTPFPGYNNGQIFASERGVPPLTLSPG